MHHMVVCDVRCSMPELRTLKHHHCAEVGEVPRISCLSFLAPRCGAMRALFNLGAAQLKDHHHVLR